MAAPKATRCFHPGKLPVIWSCLPSRPENASTTGFFYAFIVGNTIYAGKKVQVVFDGKVVVQRELLGHVSDALSHNSRSHATFARQLYLAFRWREEAAKHFYGGRLACAVGSEQAIDLAISNLQVHVVTAVKSPNRRVRLVAPIATRPCRS